MNKNVVIGIVIAIVVVGGFLAYSLSLNRQPQPVPPSPGGGVTTVPQPAPQAAIISVALSTAIAANGAPVNPATTFSSKAPAVYAVLGLQNAVRRTELSYIRYYEDKYVDTKVSHPTRDGVPYLNFKFLLKAGRTRKAGHYTLKFYVDGKRAQSIGYVVQ